MVKLVIEHFMGGLLQFDIEYEARYTKPKMVSSFLSQIGGVQPFHG